MNVLLFGSLYHELLQLHQLHVPILMVCIIRYGLYIEIKC